MRSDYYERKKANPTQGETWEDAYTRFVACIASVRELNEHIARYGSMTSDNELALRSSDYTVVKSTHNVMMPSVPLIHQRSFAAPAYEKQAGIPNTQSQPLKLAGITLKGPIAMIPLPPCRSCGHTTHKVAACPVLFYTDANNELHMEWKDSPMGKEWARHNYTAHSLDIALPGHENQYLNRFQSEFHVSMLNSPRNDF